MGIIRYKLQRTFKGLRVEELGVHALRGQRAAGGWELRGGTGASASGAEYAVAAHYPRGRRSLGTPPVPPGSGPDPPQAKVNPR
jgi:hypothetical protein